MNGLRKLTRKALDVSLLEGTPSHDLAVVVHRETEALRAIEAQEFQASVQRGDIHPPTNALQAVAGPYDASAYREWGEYAKRLEVLDRCHEALGIPAGVVATRIALELRPENAEVLYWIGAWLTAMDQKFDVEVQWRMHQAEIEKARIDRSRAAADAAMASHAKHAKAKEYVRAEWALYKTKFKNNRTKFAETYVEVLQEEFKIEVKLRTIHAVWLKGL
jgi:hypothetical protein